MAAENMRERILEFMRTPAPRPLTKSEMARALEISAADRAKLRRILQSLVAEGTLVFGEKSCYTLRGQKNQGGEMLTGTLKFNPKGLAYFYPDVTDAANQAAEIDLTVHSRIAIQRRDCSTALDGDRVLVTISRPAPRRALRMRAIPEQEPDIRGRVEKVLARRSGRLVGIFRKKQSLGWVDCDDKAVDGRVEVIGETTAQPGQLVVVDVLGWDNPQAVPAGRIIEVLGWPGDPGVDMTSIIHRFGLRTSFPDEVLAAARAVSEEPDAAEIARREDWRQRLVITIDPADAKDHDDAICLKKSPHGWSLAVHIADVSHYIKPGSEMEREARERGNSTYLVDRVLPMLPVELSNGICSLKPNVDRLTKCALLEISKSGEILKSRFVDAVIHSQSKLSYEQAQAILDGKPAPEGSPESLVPMVREGWKMASALRRRRFESGALDLEMPEIRIVLDDQGKAVDAVPVVHCESHQLIEECMLAANEAVARLLRERMKPAVYRIHEDPDPSRLLDYTQTAVLHGYRPGDLTNRDHIQKLLDASKGSPEEHLIKLGLLKSLKRAAYHAEPIGHYGLAKGDYCHFTSPIRRYADLIVHRALQPLLANRPKHPDRTPSHAELHEIARHISETERTSSDAESESKLLKLFEYLRHMAEAHEERMFDGLITDVRPMGLMVEIPDMGVRGIVKREDLPPGRWFLEAHRMAWVNTKGEVIQLGMRVPLQVRAIDMEKRFVDFSVAGPATGNGLRGVAQNPAVNPTQSRGKAKPKLPPKAKSAAQSGPTARSSQKITSPAKRKSSHQTKNKTKHRRKGA